MKRVALITGASRGIGAATARVLSEAGYAVCLNYIQQREKAQALAARLRSQGGEAITCQADVADRPAVEEMFQVIRRELGPVTLLVNNAGISRQAQFQDVDQALWQRTLDVNLGGCYNCVQAALPSMLHEHAGCIVNISSIWGGHGGSCETAYSASKHAVEGLTRSLAAELAPTGIRVNAVAPGVIDTDMARVLGEETLALLREEIPLGRLGRPEEIGRAVLYLAGAEYVTGQVLTVDGGFLR